MSKGMVYTSFAVMAAAMLVSGAFVLSQQEAESTSTIRITEASFFLDSVLQDMDRTLSMATRRALLASTNYIIENNQPLQRPEKNITSALINGTISGKELENMENVSIEDWADRVRRIASDSSYRLEIEVRDYGFNTSILESMSYYTVFARLEDPVSLARFNRTETAYTTASFEGLEDPMITLRSKARYVSKYERCSFDDPAEQIASAAIASTKYGYGNVTVNPSDISDIEQPSGKVLVVDDVDGYSVNNVNDFSAVVSEEPNSSSGYTNAYAFDTGSISNVKDGERILVDESEVWDTRFYRMFSSGCYITDDQGPDALDRMENRLSNTDGTGLATMIDVSKLPSELRYEDSAVAYVYFSESSYGGISEVKGVSDRYSWFRLDQYHVDSWEMNSITK